MESVKNMQCYDIKKSFSIVKSLIKNKIKINKNYFDIILYYSININI